MTTPPTAAPTTPPAAQPVAPTHVAIPVAAAEALAGYLTGRPYGEVVTHVNALLGGVGITLTPVEPPAPAAPARPALVPDTPPAAPPTSPPAE